MRILLRVGGILLLLFLTVSLLFTGCMTFRKSDAKSVKYFKERKVEVQIHQTSFDNKNLHYLETTRLSETSPLIVFVHGAPGAAGDFYKYLADSTLLTKFHMVAMDRLGYGYSDYGKSEVSIQKQADAVRAIVDLFPKASKVILVGHSYGGPIVAKCAMDFQNKLSAIIMLAPVNDAESEKIFWFASFSQWKATRWMMSKAFRVSGDEKFAHQAELRKIESGWNQITIPTVHIHGMKDKMLAPPPNIEFSKTHIRPNVLKLITMPDANHMIPWSDYDMVRKELLQLL